MPYSGNKTFKQIMDEVGSKKLDGLTVAETANLLREYSKYEKLAEREQAQNIIRLPVKIRVPSNPVPDRHGHKFSEALVGKYLMTIAAAVLCLLAAAIFAAGFWPGLPGYAKHGILLSVGTAAWALGYAKSKTSPIRPFWLGVAGFGAGISFLDVILGYSEWDLYGILPAGVLCLAWTALCFLMARRRSAWLFYLIAYAGGWIVFALSRGVIYSMRDEILCCVIAVSILAMGAAAWKYNNKHWFLALSWLVTCWYMGTGLVNIKYATVDYIDYGTAFQLRPVASWPHAYPYVCVIMACGAVWMAGKAVPAVSKYKRLPGILTAFLAFVNAQFVPFMASDLFRTGYAGSILAAGILIAGISVSKPGYILGVSAPVMFLIAGQGDWPCILGMSIAAFMACLASVRYHARIDRLGLFLAWFTAASAAISSAPGADGQGGFLAAFIILSAGLCAWTWFRYNKSDWSAGILSYFIVLCGALYLILGPSALFGWPDWFFICMCVVSITAFRRFRIPDTNPAGKYDIIARIGSAILSAASACALTFECMAFSFFGDGLSWPEPFALTVTLFLTAGMHACAMARSRKSRQGVLACLAANWCMWLSCRIWTPGARILISALGILISAAFVAAGFRLDRKPARQAGLACALLYALKLGLYDMDFDSGIGAAAGFLIAGLGCFGISLLYNRLWKALGEKHGGKEE